MIHVHPAPPLLPLALLTALALAFFARHLRDDVVMAGVALSLLVAAWVGGWL